MHKLQGSSPKNASEDMAMAKAVNDINAINPKVKTGFDSSVLIKSMIFFMAFIPLKIPFDEIFNYIYALSA